MSIGRIRSLLRDRIKDPDFEEVLHGSALVFIARTAVIPVGLVSSLVVARYYGADVMGIVALLNSFTAVLLAFALFGTNISILKLVPEYRQKHSLFTAGRVYHRILAVVLMNCLLLAAVLVPLSGVIAEKVFSKAHLGFFLGLAGGLLFLQAAARINTQMVRTLDAIKFFSAMIFFPSVASLLLLLVITFFFFHRDNPIYLNLLFPVVPLIVTGLFIYKFLAAHAPPDEGHKPPAIRQIYAASQPMFFTNIMQLVIVQTDILMLGAMRSEAEVGIYSLDARLALLTTFILTSINTVLGPKFSILYHAGSKRELMRLAQKSTALIFWATLPLLAGLVIFGYWILLLYGEAFTVGYAALVMLTIGRFIASAAGPVGYFLNMTGDAIKMRNTVMLSGLLNIALNYLLIPEYGINGAATASMVSIAFNNIVATVHIKRRFGTVFAYIPFLSAKAAQ